MVIGAFEIEPQMWVGKSTANQIRRRLSGNFGQRKWFGQTKRKFKFNSGANFLDPLAKKRSNQDTLIQKLLHLCLKINKDRYE